MLPTGKNRFRSETVEPPALALKPSAAVTRSPPLARYETLFHISTARYGGRFSCAPPSPVSPEKVLDQNVLLPLMKCRHGELPPPASYPLYMECWRLGICAVVRATEAAPPVLPAA